MEALRAGHPARAGRKATCCPKICSSNSRRKRSAKSDKQLRDLIDRLIQRMMEEGYINGQPPQVTAPPEKIAARQRGRQRDAQNQARFEITDKTIDFLGFRTLKDLLGSLGQEQLRPPRHARTGHRRRIRRRLAAHTSSATR